MRSQKRTYTHQEFLEELQRLCQAATSQRVLAHRCGISEAWLSDILRGKRDPGPKLLESLGFERIVLYRKKREE